MCKIELLVKKKKVYKIYILGEIKKEYFNLC